MRILLLDIETSPHTVHVWGLYDQNVSLNQIQETGETLCFAAKWYGDKEMVFASRTSGMKPMLKKIHALISEADAVVHYNGTKFDMPTLNKEFIRHGMGPPSPYRQIDLLRTARSQFRFASNKLDFVADFLGLGNKIRHKGHTLWTDCMKGDAKAWRTMERYNKGDVRLLERVYVKLLPWIKNHPNHGLYDEPGVPVCPACGSGKLQRRGFARSLMNKYSRYQCTGCGKWSRESVSELPKEDRQLIMRECA